MSKGLLIAYQAVVVTAYFLLSLAVGVFSICVILDLLEGRRDKRLEIRSKQAVKSY